MYKYYIYVNNVISYLGSGYQGIYIPLNIPLPSLCLYLVYFTQTTHYNMVDVLLKYIMTSKIPKHLLVT